MARWWFRNMSLSATTWSSAPARPCFARTWRTARRPVADRRDRALERVLVSVEDEMCHGGEVVVDGLVRHLGGSRDPRDGDVLGLVAGPRSGVGERGGGVGYESPVVAGGTHRQLHDAEDVALVRLAVGLDRAEAGEERPAGADDDLLDAVRVVHRA